MNVQLKRVKAHQQNLKKKKKLLQYLFSLWRHVNIFFYEHLGDYIFFYPIKNKWNNIKYAPGPEPHVFCLYYRPYRTHWSMSNSCKKKSQIVRILFYLPITIL